MQNESEQRDLIIKCFSEICCELSGLVHQIGGEKLRNRFEQSANARITARGSPIHLKGGTVSGYDEKPDWKSYREITTKTIDDAAQVAGRKTVESVVRNVTKNLEKQHSANMYETAYRLDLLKYIKS